MQTVMMPTYCPARQQAQQNTQQQHQQRRAMQRRGCISSRKHSRSQGKQAHVMKQQQQKRKPLQGSLLQSLMTSSKKQQVRTVCVLQSDQ